MLIFFKKIILDIIKLPVLIRKFIILIFEIICINIALLITQLLIGNNLSNAFRSDSLKIYIIFSLIGPIVYLFSGQYKGIIRYSDSLDFFHIFIRNVIFTYILFIVSKLFFINSIAINEFFIFFINLTLLIFLMRYLLRELIYILQRDPKNTRKLNIAIFASLDSNSKSIEFLRFDPNYNIVAILDMSLTGVGRYMYGIPVKDPKYIKKISNKIEKILVDTYNISNLERNKIVNLVGQLGLPLLSIPSMNELIRNQTRVNILKPFSIEDLLGREEVLPKKKLIGPNIKEKNILITGGGGSIGRELAIQVLKLKASRIVILDLNEFNLYEVINSLNEIEEKELLRVEIVSVLGSACDEDLVYSIFQKYKIDCIFHAAAYKHVSIVENNPLQGLKNNIYSTLILCKNAQLFRVDSMLLISSDKAVRPTNIMGVSKRISELIIQAYDKKFKLNSKSKFSLVRFGNVIGSSGSVIPLFLKQINSGGPIFVTHKDVVRYFMTIKEAVNLILQASFLAEGGDVLLLHMGEPIKIYELAKQMITLSGYRIKDEDNLDGDIEIKISGLKKGEKIFEELLINGESENTLHPRIFKGNEDFIPYEVILEDLESIDKAIKNNNIESCFSLLQKIVPEWQKNYFYI